MNSRLSGFDQMLSLRTLGQDEFSAYREPIGLGRFYGGQVLAQALKAAELTVDGLNPHSLHAYFIRSGDETLPVEISVTRHFDGRTICNRQVSVNQAGKALFVMTLSFHAPAEAYSHQARMPDVPSPEDLTPDHQFYATARQGALPGDRLGIAEKSVPFDMRFPIEHASPGGRGADEPIYHWFRACAPLGDDLSRHRALLAYASDYGLLSASARVHDLAFFRGEATGITINHSLWFHQPETRCDEWLLYVADSPWAAHGRALSRGSIYTRSGTLIASVAQESLIKLLTP